MIPTALIPFQLNPGHDYAPQFDSFHSVAVERLRGPSKSSRVVSVDSPVKLPSMQPAQVRDQRRAMPFQKTVCLDGFVSTRRPPPTQRPLRAMPSHSTSRVGSVNPGPASGSEVQVADVVEFISCSGVEDREGRAARQKLGEEFVKTEFECTTVLSGIW